MDYFSVFKSPEDSRDYIIETILSYNKPLPKVFDLRKKLKPIRNQGDIYISAAISSTCIIEYQERINNNNRNYFSPMFIYNNRINQEIDDMCGREVMKILANKGVCLEKDMKYGSIMEPNEIPDYIYDNSLKYKIKAFAKVNTIEGLKKSLLLYGPCYISFPCYSNSVQLWKPLFRGQENKGGHAMTVVGYNNEGFILRNSWGIKWGDKGYCYYPYYDFGHHWEIWTTFDDETFYESDDNISYKLSTKKLFCI